MQKPPPASPGQQLEAGRKLTRAGKYPEAIMAYDAAIAAEPGMHRAWAERGFAKLHLGDLEGAEADCSKAYELDDSPRFRGSIAYNLGLIDKKRGDLTAARVHWENSLGMRPNKVVQKALDELKTAESK
jgi:tetratricopeptide (TPR) repeat protein